jgi:hypothetical protein
MREMDLAKGQGVYTASVRISAKSLIFAGRRTTAISATDQIKRPPAT